MKEHVVFVKEKLRKARRLSLMVQKEEQDLLNYLKGLGLDLEEDVVKDNRFTLEEVVTTYVSYGDTELMDEFIKILEDLK